MLDFALLFFLFDFFSDMIFVIKIFVLLTIISFIIQHVGKGPIAIVLIIGFSYFMLFSSISWLFEWSYVLMMLLLFGVSGILVDFFFVGGGSGGGEQSPVSSGADVAKRAAVAKTGMNRAQGMVNRFRGGR